MKYLLTLVFLANFVFAQTAGTLKWKFEIGGIIESVPAIASDGTIYVTSHGKSIFAINSEGAKKWEFETGGIIRSSPSIGADGTIYFGSSDFKFYALNPDGTKKWEFDMHMFSDSSPAIGADGTIYMASGDSKLYAINPDGTEKWQFDVGYNCYSAPAIGPDGTIFIGSGFYREGFYAINPDGTKKWHSGIGGVKSSPAIGADGTIYVGSGDKNLYAVNYSDGSVKWKLKTSEAVHDSPVIDANGTIYAASIDGNFYAVNPDGTQKWKYVSNGFSIGRSAAAIGSNGIIYVGIVNPLGSENASRLVAFNSDGTIKWEYTSALVLSAATTISPSGVVYTGSYDGTIIAVNSECTGLADSPWPKFRKSTTNTAYNATATDVKNNSNSQILNSYKLEQNYPNPFNPSTTINYSISVNMDGEMANVKLTIYNILGCEVATLVNKTQSAGNYSVVFDANNLPSGLYLYKLQVGNFVDIKKMMLLK